MKHPLIINARAYSDVADKGVPSMSRLVVFRVLYRKESGLLHRCVESELSLCVHLPQAGLVGLAHTRGSFCEGWGFLQVCIRKITSALSH